MSRVLAVVLVLAATAAANELRKAETEIIRLLKKVRPSVVTIITPNKRDFDLSGVVITSNGTILTLRSPLLDERGRLPEKTAIRVAGAKSSVEAKVLDQDAGTNTVLLTAPSLRATAPRIGSVADTENGEWVLLVGNMFGAGRETTPAASLGVVSGVVRKGDDVVSLHISALVNPGSYGAPVLGSTGRLLGIVAPRITAAGGQTVVIPVDSIRAAYRAKRTAGRRAFTAYRARRTPGKTMTGAFGTVVGAATRAGREVLVGVRADRAEGEAEAPPPKKGRRTPPKSRRVPGKLQAWDRCSGTIVDAEGLILCPLRITGWPGTRRRLVVDLLDGSTFKAKVLAIDERLRIALLQIDRKDLPVLRPAARDTVRSGRFAIALGYPHDNPGVASPQVTVGIVSRTGALGQLHPAMNAIQTDAGVSGSNRGGPLIDIDGRLLGVLLDVDDTNSRGYTTRKKGAYEGNAGLGFALSMNLVTKVLPRLRKGIEFKQGFLGVTTQEGEAGLHVVKVAEKNKAGQPTAAATAGLKKGDILVELNGRAVALNGDLQRALAHSMVGDEITLVWIRGDEQMTAKVKLGAR